MFTVQNAFSGVSDTERSHRLVHVTKHLLRSEKASHLNAVCLLVEQTLGCCGREERQRERGAGPGARGYANMQQAHLAAVLIFTVQVTQL